MLAKKSVNRSKFYLKLLANCACMSSVNSSLKCQNQNLEINFFPAWAVLRYKIVLKSKIFRLYWKSYCPGRSFSIGGRPWQAGIVISLKENMVGRLCEGCGGISDYNLHYNNKKRKFSQNIFQTLSTSQRTPCVGKQSDPPILF